MLDNFNLFQDMDANHKASDSQLARKILANTELVDCIQYKSFSKDIACHEKLMQDILCHKELVQKVVNNVLTPYLPQKPELVEELVDEVTKSSHSDGTIENLEVSRELADELADDPNCPGSSEDIKRGHIQCMLRDHFQLPRITQHVVNNPKLVERLVKDSQFTLPLEDDSVLIQGIEYNSKPVRRYRAWQKLVRYLEGKPTLAQEIAECLNLSRDIAENLEHPQYKLARYKLDQCLKDKPRLARDIAKNLELALDIANNPELARYELAQYKLARYKLSQCLKDNPTLTQDIAKKILSLLSTY